MAVQLWSKSDGKSYGTGAEMKKQESDINATIKKWDSKLKTMSVEEIEDFLKKHKAETASFQKEADKIAKLRVRWHAEMQAELNDVEQDARKKADELIVDLVKPSKALYEEGALEAITCVNASSNAVFAMTNFTSDIETALKEAKKKAG